MPRGGESCRVARGAATGVNALLTLSWPCCLAMRIDGAPQIQPSTTQRNARAAGSDRNFADALANERPVAAPAAPAAPPAIDGLFALQEVADGLAGRRRATARGTALLDKLDELRLALLSGRMPRAQLEALRQLAREHGPSIDDPKLAAVLAEIELRVAVELAKLDLIA